MSTRRELKAHNVALALLKQSAELSETSRSSRLSHEDRAAHRPPQVLKTTNGATRRGAQPQHNHRRDAVQETTNSLRDVSGPAVGIDYHRARTFLRWYEGVLHIHDTAASALADQHVGPTETPTPENLEQLLTDVHRILLAHPVATRRAFAALVAEGRTYAATPEGQKLHHRLLHSARVQQASRLFRALSMGMLNAEKTTTRLPSSYLDNLLRVVNSKKLESMVGNLLQKLRR